LPDHGVASSHDHFGRPSHSFSFLDVGVVVALVFRSEAVFEAHKGDPLDVQPVEVALGLEPVVFSEVEDDLPVHASAFLIGFEVVYIALELALNFGAFRSVPFRRFFLVIFPEIWVDIWVVIWDRLQIGELENLAAALPARGWALLIGHEFVHASFSLAFAEDFFVFAVNSKVLLKTYALGLASKIRPNTYRLF
jgi:hypothetical protein